jgi:hypothetical protein
MESFPRHPSRLRWPANGATAEQPRATPGTKLDVMQLVGRAYIYLRWPHSRWTMLVTLPSWLEPAKASYNGVTPLVLGS